MKKLLLLIGIIFLFSCEKESCRICTMHQTSIPIIPSWEKMFKFEVCGDDLNYWNGKVDTLFLGDIIYMTKTTCNNRIITK